MDKEQLKMKRAIEVAQEKQDADMQAAKHLEARQIKQAQRKEQL